MSNIFIGLVSLWLVFFLVGHESTNTHFIRKYNNALLFTSVLGVAWLSISIFDWGIHLGAHYKKAVHTEEKYKFIFQFSTLILGMITTVVAFNAIKGGSDIFPIPKDLGVTIKNIGFMSPFMFSFLVLSAGLLIMAGK